MDVAPWERRRDAPAYARAGALPVIDGYFGREYPGRGPLEVIPRACETLFAPFDGRERLGELLDDDPGLADLISPGDIELLCWMGIEPRDDGPAGPP